MQDREPAMADINNATERSMNGANNSKPHLIFTYGTLKQGFPNHHLMQDLISKGKAALRGTYSTHNSYPLVRGPYCIPYLINQPGSGHRVKGELYVVLPEGLPRLDGFEGVSTGHYERLPVQVADVSFSQEVEAYFAHRNFGERLWKKNGEVGMMEYTEEDATKYMRMTKENRQKGKTITVVIHEFLNS